MLQGIPLGQPDQQLPFDVIADNDNLDQVSGASRAQFPGELVVAANGDTFKPDQDVSGSYAGYLCGTSTQHFRKANSGTLKGHIHEPTEEGTEKPLSADGFGNRINDHGVCRSDRHTRIIDNPYELAGKVDDLFRSLDVDSLEIVRRSVIVGVQAEKKKSTGMPFRLKLR